MSSEEKNFVGGFYPKEPKVDFIKCSIGINKNEFIEWFKQQDPNEEWINIDIKAGQSGKLYAEKNNWKPKPKDEGNVPPF